jgi:hypothetical protein
VTDPQRIRRLTALEERLVQAFEALSAVLDDEDTLAEVTVPAFDIKDPDRVRSIDAEIKKTNETVKWAIAAARKALSKLGAIEER